MRTTMKKTIKRPQIRSLKINPKFRVNQESTVMVPEIRLCGNWLQKLGFEPEERVLITAMNKTLIIQLEE